MGDTVTPSVAAPGDTNPSDATVPALSTVDFDDVSICGEIKGMRLPWRKKLIHLSI